MPVYKVTGGTITCREKLTVGARKVLQSAMFASSSVFLGSQQDALAGGIELKDGTIATSDSLKTVSDLTKLPSDFFSSERLETMLNLQKASIIAFLESWSFKQPLPTMDTIEDMDADLFDEISEIVSPLVGKAFQSSNFSKGELADLKAEPTS